MEVYKVKRLNLSAIPQAPDANQFQRYFNSPKKSLIKPGHLTIIYPKFKAKSQ